MPLDRTISRAIGKVRQAGTPSRNFNTVQDIVIPAEVAEIEFEGVAECIVLFDTGPNDINRMIGFSNVRLVQLAEESTKFQMDGTFSKAPKIYNNGTTNHGQLYTLQAERNGLLIHVLYVLMKIRNQTEYSRLFSKLIDLGMFNPTHVLMDLELAARNSIRNHFPNCIITVCYYHFQESLYSWLSMHQMKSRYAEDTTFRKTVHKFGALAFVPTEYVLDAWRILNNEVNEIHENDPDIEEFISYFTSSFIGRIREDGRQNQPRYPIEQWNQYFNVMNDAARRNNQVEGWHNALNHLNHCDHPNLFRLMDMIKMDMTKSRIRLIQDNPTPKRPIYRDLNKKILRLCESFQENNIIRFLIDVSNVYHSY